ncbi:MAG: hypothetical protein ACK55Z_26380, partial [bacterium]
MRGKHLGTTGESGQGKTTAAETIAQVHANTKSQRLLQSRSRLSVDFVGPQWATRQAEVEGRHLETGKLRRSGHRRRG